MYLISFTPVQLLAAAGRQGGHSSRVSTLTILQRIFIFRLKLSVNTLNTLPHMQAHICIYMCVCTSTSDHLYDTQFFADACRLWCPLTQQQQPTARPFYFKAEFKITLTRAHTHTNTYSSMPHLFYVGEFLDTNVHMYVHTHMHKFLVMFICENVKKFYVSLKKWVQSERMRGSKVKSNEQTSPVPKTVERNNFQSRLEFCWFL